MRYWTTEQRPVGEQFSYWRDVLCQAFTPLAAERVPSVHDDPRLRSWVKSSMLASTNCAQAASQTQLISHGSAELRRTSEAYVFVNLMLRGTCLVSQDGRTTLVPTGSFSMVDTTSEYRQEYVEDPDSKEWQVISFRVPRANLIPLLADPRSFTAIAQGPGAAGITNVATSTMLSIWDNIGRFTPSDAHAAESAMTAVLAASLGGNDTLQDQSRETLNAALRASINRYLAANLRGSADLSAPRVAHMFGISVRKLHSLYEDADRTYAQTITALRVEGCARELASPEQRSSLTEIATRWGFCDLSHLNRVFRAHYDCLPSQYRESNVGTHQPREISASQLRK